VPDVVRAAACNLADWHESWLSGLGLSCGRSRALWWCRDASPFIYHGAVTLARASRELFDEVAQLRSQRAGGSFSVCDSWDELDLGGLGFTPFQAGRWLVRAPAPARREPPPELSVEQVRADSELETFERASIDGFESPALHRLGRFGVHPPAALADERMNLFAGRVSDRVVSVSMAYRSNDVVGVYGVATLPEFRRRGYGREMTWAATLVAPDLPAVLQPSPAGEATYRSMGFEDAGHFTTWVWVEGGKERAPTAPDASAAEHSGALRR
jgi:GNAT superfamily N-acetyltransferase